MRSGLHPSSGGHFVSLPTLPVTHSPVEKFREYLSSRSTPQRFTDQQRELVEFIFASHSHFDADQLIREIDDSKLNISRATIYRTLTKLVDAGMLRKMEIGTRTVYEHDYGYPQHEHLVCVSCEKIVEFQLPAIESIFNDIARQHQFQIEGHTILIRGKCFACSQARSKRRLDMI
jgi:Fur family ferric uptake transcriptional regulator